MRSFCLSVVLLFMMVIGNPTYFHAASRFPPGQRWWKAESEHFILHYPENLASIAVIAAKRAEKAYHAVTKDLGLTVKRIHLVLTDHTDFANGFTSLFPKPLIVVFITPPHTGETIGDYDDWLTTVLVHEITHAVQLEDAHSIYKILRSVIGRNPVAFPNLWAPDWYTEGLAVFEETRWTTGGRACSAETRALLDAVREAREPETLDREWIDRIRWPGGLSPYHFGGAFLAYTFTTARAHWFEGIRAKNHTLFPFFLDGAEKKILGRSFNEAWLDWIQASVKSERGPVEVIDDPGYMVRSLRFAGRRICYGMARPHEYPGIFCIRPGEQKRKRLKEGIGIDWFGISSGGQWLVYSSLDLNKTYQERFQLHIANLKSGKSYRPNDGLRLAMPDVREDGTVVAVRKEPRGETSLVLIPFAGKAIPVEPPSRVVYQYPRWTPNGKGFVTVVHLPDGKNCFDFYSEKGERTWRALCDTSRKVEPAWSSDGKVLWFAADYRGRFEIYTWESGTQENPKRISPDGYEWRSPLPDEHGFYVLEYTSHGYRVVRVRCIGQEIQPIPPEEKTETDECSIRTVPGEREGVDAWTWTSSPRQERIRPVLLPFTWFPYITIQDGRWRPSLRAVGEEIRGYFGYVAQAEYAPEAQELGYDLQYRIDRWYPTTWLHVSRTIEDITGGDSIIEQNSEIFFQIPYRRFRWVAGMSVGGRFQKFYLKNADGKRKFLGKQWTLPFSLFYSRAIQYGASVSPEDGFSAALFGNLGFGEDRYRTIGLDAAFYLPGLLRHHVTTLRLRVLSSDGQNPEILSFGSETTDLGPIRRLGHTVRLIRGGALLNLEYRFPIYEIQRGFGQAPLFLHRVSGALFFDWARLSNHPIMQEITPNIAHREIFYAMGGEVRLQFVLKGWLDTLLRAGVAWDPKDLRSRRFYVGLGWPF